MFTNEQDLYRYICYRPATQTFCVFAPRQADRLKQVGHYTTLAEAIAVRDAVLQSVQSEIELPV
jgi:hypothetical protein